MSQQSKTSEIVILGCGIYGLSTAYYTAKLRGHGQNITIIDVARCYCAGASGRPTAFLSGDSTNEPDLDKVVQYSLALHADLASEFDGCTRWQYGKVVSYNASTTSDAGTSSAQVARQQISDARPRGFHWLASEWPWTAATWSPPEDYISIDPGALGAFLHDKAVALGVTTIFSTETVKVNMQNGRDVSSLVIRTKSESSAFEREVPCDRLIIATGPWTSKTFATLYPESDLKVPIYADRGSYSLLLKPLPEGLLEPECRNKSVVLHANLPSLHLITRPDGTIHAATTPSATLHRAAADLHEVETGIQSLLAVDSEICHRQVCFNPETYSGIPIMSKVPSCSLRQDALENSESGVYVVGGHGYWGVTASLGSGKLMAQLVLGKKPDLGLAKFRLQPPRSDRKFQERELVTSLASFACHGFTAFTSFWGDCFRPSPYESAGDASSSYSQETVGKEKY